MSEQDDSRIGVQELVTAVRGMQMRGTIVAVNDDPKMQTLDIRLNDGRLVTKVEHWQPSGFDFKPHVGAEVLVSAIGGSPDHLIAHSAADRRYRFKHTNDGGLAVHDTERDQFFRVSDEGVVLKSAIAVTIECPGGVTIKGPTTVEGDITHTGNMTTSGVHVDSNGPH